MSTEEIAVQQKKLRNQYRKARNTRIFYMAVVATGLGMYYDWKIGLVAFVIWTVSEVMFSYFERP